MQNRPITLSDNAAAHIKTEINKSNNNHQDGNAIIGLRLAVKKTGCSGYAYVVDFVKEQEQFSKQDHIFTSHDITIYVDNLSYEFVAGTEIDYVKKHLTSVMVFNNPNTTAECGCGESFTIDKSK